MPSFTEAFDWESYKISIQPSDRIRSLMHVIFRDAIPSYTWGDYIYFDLRIIKKNSSKEDVIHYDWKLCDKYNNTYEIPQTLDIQTKGNGSIILKYIKRRFHFKKWEEGEIICESPSAFYQFHSINIGCIPDVNQYNLVMKFTDINGKTSQDKVMARFRITDLEDKADRNWGLLLGLICGVIGTIIGAIVVYVVIGGH